LHVDELAHLEQPTGTTVPALLSGDFRDDGGIPSGSTGFDAGLCKVTSRRLDHAEPCALPKSDLDAGVAVGVDVFTWVTRLLDTSITVTGTASPVVRKDAHHAHLATQQSETIA